jgi:hypothetical protein
MWQTTISVIAESEAAAREAAVEMLGGGSTIPRDDLSRELRLGEVTDLEVIKHRMTYSQDPDDKPDYLK